MAISNLDQLIAGFKAPVPFIKTNATGEAAGQMHNLLALAGNPGAATLGTPGMGGVAITSASSINGMLSYTDPTGGQDGYLGRWGICLGQNIVGCILYDLLWYQSGIVVTTTTAQTVTSVAWPARSKDGTVNGDGVEIWIHCQTATTNGSTIAGTTYSYTNQNGTAGQSAGTAYVWPATAVAGTVVPLVLAGNDTGVRSVQTITLTTSYGGGAINLLALRRIASAMLPAPFIGMNIDPFMLGMPRLFNGSALYMAVVMSTASPGAAAFSVCGEVNYAQG